MDQLINRTLLRDDLRQINSGRNTTLEKLGKVVSLIRDSGLVTTNNGTLTPHWRSLLRPGRVWEYDSLLKLAELENRSLRILDCGGASTPLVFYLGQLGCEVHTIDLNGDLVQNTLRVAKHFGWNNIQAYQQDMRKLEFPDNYFDRVISVSVVEHIIDDSGQEEAIHEMSRVLKPGGILGLTVDFGDVPAVSGHKPLPSLPEVYRLLINPAGQNGLRLIGNQEVMDGGQRHFRRSIRSFLLFKKYTFLRLIFKKTANKSL